MLPLVSNDAIAILFMFDLGRPSTLNSVKEWYRQARGFNKVKAHATQLIVDGDSTIDWDEVRRLHGAFTRRTRRDYKTSQAVL